MEKQSIGRMLCEARKEKGYSQQVVAHWIGITAGAYSKIETDVNALRVQHMRTLSHRLGIDFAKMLAACGMSMEEYRKRIARESGFEPSVSEVIRKKGENSYLGEYKKLHTIGINLAKAESLMSFVESVVGTHRTYSQIETAEILLLSSIMIFLWNYCYDGQCTLGNVRRLVSASVCDYGYDEWEMSAMDVIIDQLRPFIQGDDNLDELLYYYDMFSKITPDHVKRAAAGDLFYKISKLGTTATVDGEIFYDIPRKETVIEEDSGIEKLEFSSDCQSVLKAAEIHTVRDLTEKTPDELRGMAGMTSEILDEIVIKLFQKGFGTKDFHVFFHNSDF